MEKKSAAISSPKRQPRESNIELLRILAMLMIIICHSMVFGLKMHYQFKNDFQTLVLQGFCFIGPLGNYLFIFISGYFLTGAGFSVKKIFKLWREVFFYSVTFALFFYFSKLPCYSIESLNNFGPQVDTTLAPCDIKKLVASFTPFFRSSSQWFVSCYILFYICSPFLNKMVSALSQREHLALAALSAFFVMIVPSIPRDGISNYYYNNNYLIIFITLFFTASYIRLHPVKFLDNARRSGILSIVLFLFFIFVRMAASVIVANGLADSMPFRLLSIPQNEIKFLGTFCTMRSFLQLLLTVLIFSTFKNMKIKRSRVINTLAGTTLGVYLIHDNAFLRFFMWFKILRLPERFGESGFFFHLVLIGITIFAVCSAIDLVRQKLFALCKKAYGR